MMSRSLSILNILCTLPKDLTPTSRYWDHPFHSPEIFHSDSLRVETLMSCCVGTKCRLQHRTTYYLLREYWTSNSFPSQLTQVVCILSRRGECIKFLENFPELLDSFVQMLQWNKLDATLHTRFQTCFWGRKTEFHFYSCHNPKEPTAIKSQM